MSEANKVLSVFRPVHSAVFSEPPYHEWVQGQARAKALQEAEEKAKADLAHREVHLSRQERLEREKEREDAANSAMLEKKRLELLANSAKIVVIEDEQIIPTMAIDVTQPKRSEVQIDDPPIFVVSFNSFKAHGKLPVYPECVVPLATVDMERSLIVFLSHAWVELPGKTLSRRIIVPKKKEKPAVDTSSFYFDGVVCV
jgi:hypothetical protein